MARVIVRDLGFTALNRRLAAVQTLSVTVGVHEAEGAVAHQRGTGITVAAVGAIHEFGAGVPQRSWLRAPVDASDSEIKAAMRRMGRGIVSNRRRLPPRVALDFLGQFVLRKVQAHIAGNIPPPLAAATVARKGDNLALVDSSQFLDSIKSKVR